MSSGQRTVTTVVDEAEEKASGGAGQPAITTDWLRLYSSPTVSGTGRHVAKHPNANNYDWGMPEELKGLISDNLLPVNARKVTGKTPIKASNNVYMDAEGRYWVAVGPNVMNPNYKDAFIVKDSDMQYGTKIDIHVVGQHDGIHYYIPAVIGDVKNHTYPDGLYQTGVEMVTHTVEADNADGSTIEFMGYEILNKSGVYNPDGKNSSVTSTNDYRLIEIIVYDGVLNY